MVEVDDSLFGCDYSSNGGVTSRGDMELIEGLDNAKQNIHNQLLTEKGFYPSIDDGYGSEIYEIFGEDYEEPSVEALIIYIQNALLENERVKNINRIDPVTTVKGELVIILEVELVNGTEESVNLEFGEFGGIE